MRAARLGILLLGLGLPASLWAASAVKPAAHPPKAVRASAPAVADALLGIRLGMDLDDAHDRLKALGTPGAGVADKDAGRDTDKAGDKPGADEDADEGHQEVWTLRGTPYARIALASDDQGKVMWVTGFVRPGQEIPFARLGDPSRAVARTNDRVLWNVIRPYHLYRLRAAGKNGRANVVSLISLRPANPNGIFSPQTVPGAAKARDKDTDKDRAGTRKD